MSSLFNSSEFIIPNGTIVRLYGLKQKASYNSRYGKVVDWVERIGANDEADTSYYFIQMSSADIICVEMANVRLWSLNSVEKALCDYIDIVQFKKIH